MEHPIALLCTLTVNSEGSIEVDRGASSRYGRQSEMR
jgi:hypothetical protein